MIRKYNYTSRKKISSKNIEISLKTERGKTYFDVIIEPLDSLDIDSNAKLILEAFDRGSYQRYDCGSVSTPTLPEPRKRVLTEIQEAEMVSFRLRAIDFSEDIGKIIATTADIRVWAEEVDESRKSSLLPVRRENIGNSVWEMNFDVADDGFPELIISDRFANEMVTEMLRSDAFFTALVYPSALREILIQVIIINDVRTIDGVDSWGCKWLQFVHNLPNVEPLQSDTNLNRDLKWINEAVNQFCNQHSMINTILNKYRNDN